MQVSAPSCISVGRAAMTLLWGVTDSNFTPNLPHESHNCSGTAGLPSTALLLALPTRQAVLSLTVLSQSAAEKVPLATRLLSAGGRGV